MGLGSALGAVGSVVGGILGAKSSASAQAANAAAMMGINALNYEHQKEFAQNSIRWKVADAKAAGLHPLAALGAQGTGFSPSFQMGQGQSGDDYSWLGQAGQYAGRAMEAKMTERERAQQQALRDKDTALNLENKQLQNDLLRSQIRSSEAAILRQAGGIPAMPLTNSSQTSGQTIQGQAQSYATGETKKVPVEVAASQPSSPWQQAGHSPDTQLIRTGKNTYSLQMSDAAREATEDNFLGKLQWYWRNYGGETVRMLSGKHPNAPDIPTPAGTRWHWDPIAGEFYIGPSLFSNRAPRSKAFNRSVNWRSRSYGGRF